MVLQVHHGSIQKEKEEEEEEREERQEKVKEKTCA